MLAKQQSEKYKRHRPETTLLYQLVDRYYPDFIANLAEQGKYLPKYIEREFDEFLRCDRLEYVFLRVVCGDCKHEKLVAFSCKSEGFCPSRGGRRMAESAALLVDDVLQGADEPEKLERLCRYISRPAVSEQRLCMTDQGKVRYELKTPYRDGTTHVFFHPIDFIGKLAALIPPSRLNLSRFYGVRVSALWVFAPNSNLRAQVTASQRGKNSPRLFNIGDEHSAKPYHARSMTWAQRPVTG